MDLNGDGKQDLLTGCFEGGLYWMEGKGSLNFAPPTAVMDSKDQILRLGQFWSDEDSEWKRSKQKLGISGHAVDFDDDGDLDLLLGSNDGHIFLRKNNGTHTQPLFDTENIAINSGESDDAIPLKTGDGHAMPIAFDWDQDGKFDLISGSDHSGVWWAKNIGNNGAAKFAPMEKLLEASQQDNQGFSMGIRLQVAAGDFNADGKPDLLVGDYNNVKLPDTRTPKELQKHRELFFTVGELMEKMLEAKAKFQTARDSDDPPAEEILAPMKEEMLALEQEYKTLSQQYRAALPKTKLMGFVWLFQQK